MWSSFTHFSNFYILNLCNWQTFSNITICKIPHCNMTNAAKCSFCHSMCSIDCVTVTWVCEVLSLVLTFCTFQTGRNMMLNYTLSTTKAKFKNKSCKIVKFLHWSFANAIGSMFCMYDLINPWITSVVMFEFLSLCLLRDSVQTPGWQWCSGSPN